MAVISLAVPRSHTSKGFSYQYDPVNMNPSNKSSESPQIEGPSNDQTGPPILKSQICTVLSHPPEQRIFSSSLSNLTANTQSSCPGNPVADPLSSTTSFLVISS